MKTYVILIVALLTIIPASSVCAQEASVRVSLGSATPITKVYDDGWDRGWSLGLSWDIPVSGSFSIRPVGDFSRFPLDEGAFLRTSSGTVGNLSGGEIGVLRLMLLGSYGFETGSAFTPYVTAGGGFHRVSLSSLNASNIFAEIEITDGGAEKAFGTSIGGGVEYEHNEKVGLFLELDYTTSYITDESFSFLGSRMGVSISSW